MQFDCDIAIVGGGLVGSSLACALDGSGLRVAQVEAQPPRTGEPAWDERHFALARRSVQALAAWGVWPHASAEAEPIGHVHVSSRGDFGAVRIHAAEYGLDALGATLPARALGAALERRLAQCTTLERIAPARVAAFAADGEAGVLTLDGARTLRARLVVAADGTDSFLRAAVGIPADTRDYAQVAIATNVVGARAHDGWATERFVRDGALALLPLRDERCGLVWTLPAADAESAMALDDAAFLARVAATGGTRFAGLRRLGRRQAWPLRLTRASAVTAPRLVLVGNAAQTIHPIGAQGFNLGVRDVAGLVELLAAGGDPGDAALLARHAARREPDRERTIGWSDALVRWFGLDTPLGGAARGVALAVLERAPPLKRELAFAMMGYRDAGATAIADAH
jgi:2-octaprenyl-6-methoxyphenol hydroxylase